MIIVEVWGRPCYEGEGQGRGAGSAVALTAYARIEDRTRALRASYQMRVAKPVELAEFVAVVWSLLKRGTGGQTKQPAG
jgi:DNA-binding response OmpR family regulator